MKSNLDLFSPDSLVQNDAYCTLNSHHSALFSLLGNSIGWGSVIWWIPPLSESLKERIRNRNGFNSHTRIHKQFGTTFVIDQYNLNLEKITKILVTWQTVWRNIQGCDIVSFCHFIIAYNKVKNVVTSSNCILKLSSNYLGVNFLTVGCTFRQYLLVYDWNSYLTIMVLKLWLCKTSSNRLLHLQNNLLSFYPSLGKAYPAARLQSSEIFMSWQKIRKLIPWEHFINTPKPSVVGTKRPCRVISWHKRSRGLARTARGTPPHHRSIGR